MAKPKASGTKKTKTKPKSGAKRTVKKKASSSKKSSTRKKSATQKRAGKAAKKKTAAKKKAAGRKKQAGTKKKTAAKKKPASQKSKSRGGSAASKRSQAKTKTGETARKKPGKTADAAPAKQPARGRSRTKILPRDFMIDLAGAIRDAVMPAVKAAKGREIIGQATSGDVTFELDRIAEKALLAHLKQARMPVAYYSEDEGYATFTGTQPENLLIVDPVDGTRAAKSGFEGSVVAVASTRVIERPRMADVDSGCVMEILGDRVFYAERGKGARYYMDGRTKRSRLSQNVDLETLSWSMTVPARPAELIFPTAARLIDLTSFKGAFFACNSTSFSLTRMLTNQLDACVDFANRYLRDIPDLVQDHFINAGRGVTLGIAPYDLAASLLIAREAGCTVTDAYGDDFDDVLLLDSGDTNHRSLIAASNAELHAKLMSFFDTRINQFELLLKRRAGRAD